MIPRKKIKSLIGIFRIFCFIGIAGRALAYQTQNTIHDDPKATDPLIYKNLILKDYYKLRASTGSYSDVPSTVDYSGGTQDTANVFENTSPKLRKTAATPRTYSDVPSTVDYSGGTQDTASGFENTLPNLRETAATPRTYSDVPSTVDYSGGTQDTASGFENTSPKLHETAATPRTYSDVPPTVDHSGGTQDTASVFENTSPKLRKTTATPRTYSDVPSTVDYSGGTQDSTRIFKSNSPVDVDKSTFASYWKTSTTVGDLTGTRNAAVMFDSNLPAIRKSNINSGLYSTTSDTDSPDDYNLLTTNDVSSQSYTTAGRAVGTQDFNDISEDETVGTVAATSEYATTESSSCSDTPGNVQNLTLSSTSNSLRVTWLPPESSEECILAYNVTWFARGNDSESGSRNTSELELTVSGLTSCRYFTIGVTAVGIYASGDVVSIAGDTAESEISTVQNIVVFDLEAGVNITWDAPDDVSCLENYRLEVVTKNPVTGFPTTVFTPVTYREFHDIPPCTAFAVTITPTSISGIFGLNATVDAETHAVVPGAVGDLTAPSNGTTAHSVYLTWSNPATDATCVLYYEVDICQGDNCTTVTAVDDKFYNATNLSPCLNYTFAVRAVGSAGSSDPMTTAAETSYSTPAAPDSVQVTGGQFSLKISWNAPLTGATCMTGYRVILWGTTVTSTTTEKNITIPNLSACKSYTVQITSVGTQGRDGGFVATPGITEMSVTAPPALEIDDSQVTRSTITFGVRVNGTSNECELRNFLTICNYTSTDGHGIDPINGESADDISGFNSSTDASINVTVRYLSPFSWYECYAMTENIAGFSKPSIAVVARTTADVPSAPTISLSHLANSQFTLVWERPEYLPGLLIEHEIILSWKRRFLMPSFCEENNSTSTEISKIDGAAREYLFPNATSFSEYAARIRAKTSAGWGNYSDDLIFRTNASLPGPIGDMQYLNKSNTADSNMLDTFLYWRLPCALNGEIESFLIYFHGTRDRAGFENHTFSQIYNVTNITDADYKFEINLGELKAEYNYTFEISAKVVGVYGYGASISHNVVYPAGIPPWPEDSYMEALRVNPYKAMRTSSTATILLPLFDDANGDVRYYAIMISQLGYSHHERKRFDILSGNWPNVTSWHDAISQNPIVNYQTTAIRWQPDETGNVGIFGGLKAVRYTLGDDVSCVQSLSRSFCNGPLEPDTSYQIRMRAFTNGGYRDSLAFVAKTKAEFNLGLAIGVVFGILFFGIMVTMTFLIRKGVLHSLWSNLLNRSAHNVPVLQPMTRKKFKLHCQELIEHPGKLSNEFQLLQTLSVDLEMSAHAAVLQANRKKNRYINILPYDISRVKLEVLNNDPNTDYINASFMPGYSGISEYIACQGPKEETTYDFWRMIFQYNVKVIVMVTQLVEKGRDKCHQYYPNVRENFEYEDITIRCSTQLDFVSYTQRIITLQNGKTRRTVTHLHFKEWSDHGVPDDVHSMIDFCQTVRKQTIDNKSLAVIHCSAGVGRTGTLIAIDILLQQIKDNKKLDVFGTVYKLRQHRMSMVQTESQYAYIYNCTREALNNPYPQKPYKPPSGDPIYENLKKKQREITDSNTNLVNSAETLKKISPSPSADSVEPICEIVEPQRPIYLTQLSTLSQASGGLRYSKSTGAISTHIQQSPQLVRYGSHEYPIFEPAPDSPSSRRSRDRNSLLEFARPIRIETRINRPKSGS